jgi:perosamine synthetase
MKIREQMLPVSQPLGGVDDIEGLAQVINSGWWGKGPRVEEFERSFAEMVGVKYALAVSSASAGQDLVLKAIKASGHDVISPTISFLTTGVVPLWNNCKSLLVDVRREDLNLNPESVRKRLTRKTKAVVAVHYAGVLSSIDEIREFYDGFVLEDCAHACFTQGAGIKGDAAVWSFQAVKTLPTGDGGMITTNDKVLYEKLIPMTWFGIPSTYSRVRNNGDSLTGRPGYTWEYEVEEIGYKAYMHDLTATLGLTQMKKLDENLAKRRHVQRRYNSELPKIIERPYWTETGQYYSARVPAYLRDALINYLSAKKIHTSVHYKPLHKHPLLAQKFDFSVANSEWEKLISLPCHSALRDEDIDYVVYWVTKFFDGEGSS